MLRYIATLLLMAGLLALPATARADNGGPGGGKNTYSFASLRIHNAVDDAVAIALGGVPSAVLESGEVRTFDFLVSGQKTTVEVTASLVSDPSVSATASVELQKNKTADVTVVYSGGTLSLDVQRPAKANNGKK
jgi:hypothetical protein